MKSTLCLRLFWASTLFFCVFSTTIAQTDSRNYRNTGHAKHTHLAPPPLARAQQQQTVIQPAWGTDCDNDQTAPSIQCAVGAFSPDARAAYLVSYYGEPWGASDNLIAMEAAFGPGNWDALFMEDVGAGAPIVFSPLYKAIFIDGSESGGFVLEAFLAAHLPALEQWVAAGGALFINCAPNSGPPTIPLGFGGVSLQSFIYSTYAVAQVPGHPVFNEPFSPANGDFYGNSFLHASIVGDAGTVLIADATVNTIVGLTEKNWGLGKVYFGAMTMPSFHSPQPNAQHLRQNILADLSTFFNQGVILATDAGQCFSTITDASLDATATDECTLVSLTHDFAAVPSNTSLNGAVLPTGNTVVTWTAKDAAGNTSTCQTFISVRDPNAPTVTCPSDFTVNADPGICGSVVGFDVLATDDCSQAPTITTVPPSGSLFPNGNTTVLVSATDDSYNRGTCVFTISVTAHPEICNGIDDNCDGWVDEDVTDVTTFYLDADFDGYGTPEQTTTGIGCIPPWGYSVNALDCDDANYYVHPNAYEYCNEIDDNCDGNIDEGVAPTWYADADHDGYGDPNTAVLACQQPLDFVSNNWDCVDTDAYINPNALEDCTNQTDENCDGILGENNFTIEETHTDVFCGSNPDGSIQISMVPAQHYPRTLWSNGVCCTTELSNLDFGTYTVTVTNECGTTKTKTIVIQPSAEPPLQVTLSGTDKICGGSSDGTISATPFDGCGGYTYLWNTGSTESSLSGLTGGYYHVVVTDACGCTRSNTFDVFQPAQLGLYQGYVVPLLDGTYFVQMVPTDGVPPYKFRHSTPTGFTDWSVGNGFLGLAAGEYVFEVEDAIGCTAQTTIFLAPLSPRPVDGAGQSADEKSVAQRESSQVPWAGSVLLFPNPNSGQFSVDLRQPAPAETLLGITDASGRLLLEKQVAENDSIHTVEAGNLSAGLYFLQVLSQGKVLAVSSFVKD